MQKQLRKPPLYSQLAAITSAIRDGGKSDPINIEITIVVIVIVNCLLTWLEAASTKDVAKYLHNMSDDDDLRRSRAYLKAANADLYQRFEEFCSPDSKLLRASPETPEYEIEGLDLIKACMEIMRREHARNSAA
jgi:hypothetical protein